jgi:hypothetical protein
MISTGTNQAGQTRRIQLSFVPQHNIGRIVSYVIPVGVSLRLEAVSCRFCGQINREMFRVPEGHLFDVRDARLSLNQTNGLHYR